MAEKQPEVIRRKKSRITDYLSTSGYYICISKEPLPLRWDLAEDSPAGIYFEAGNVVRMRSFVYKEPHLWAEVLSGGFVCAGVGDTRKDAADVLLEEYFEPYRLNENDAPVKRTSVKTSRSEATKEDDGKGNVAPEAPQSTTEVASRKDRKDDPEASKDLSRKPARSPSVSSSDSGDELADAMAERIVELFRLFDVDSNGTIDAAELGAVMQRCDPRKWTDAKVNELLAVMDMDKDRRISYEEFIHWICGTVRWRKARKDFFKQIGVTGDELNAMKYAVHKRGWKHHGPVADAAACESEAVVQYSSESQRRGSQDRSSANERQLQVSSRGPAQSKETSRQSSREAPIPSSREQSGSKRAPSSR